MTGKYPPAVYRRYMVLTAQRLHVRMMQTGLDLVRAGQAAHAVWVGERREHFERWAQEHAGMNVLRGDAVSAGGLGMHHTDAFVYLT